MAFALVGSLGAVTQGASSAAVTPAYGQTPTANNLLICWVGVAGGTSPGTPSGWTLALLGHTGSGSGSAALFYKIAAGGDAAPTVPAVSGGVIAAQLGEFSGGAVPAVEDRGASASAITSTPTTMTAAGADAAAGELIAYAVSMFYSAGATKTNTMALNNGATAHDVNNNATSTTNHYLFGYGITTTNAAADVATLTWTTTKNAASGAAFSVFRLPSVAAAALPTQLLGIRSPKRVAAHRRSRGQF